MQRSSAGTVKFNEIYALPCSQHRLPAFDYERFRKSDNAGFQMCCGVPFEMMVSVFPWNYFVDFPFKISYYIGICIFIYGYGCRCMGNKNRTKPGFYAALQYNAPNFARCILHLSVSICFYVYCFHGPSCFQFAHRRLFFILENLRQALKA